MAINKIGSVVGPKGAIPTSRGWINPKTGELLKSQRITQEQLDAYNGVQVLAEPVIPEPVEEDPHVYADDIEAEVQEVMKPAPKPKKKSKKQSKKFSLFG